jgi:hypothetical protein
VTGRSTADAWPQLPWAAWQDSGETLQLWTQIVGKIRMAQAPMVNHWWQVALYVTARGLTTSPMPYGMQTFQIDFDFIDHRLIIQVGDGRIDAFPLQPMSVADFHRILVERLRRLGLAVHIWTRPQELPDVIPFDQDRRHATYQASHVHDFWRALVQADRVLNRFRGDYLGKVSPVHFFWGSFDLCVTRFSGRPAPPHPGGVPNLADWVVREAYSHEVSSCGFWPGNGGFGRAAFYSYAYPEPAGFDAGTVPDGAFYDANLREFILPYDVVREAEAPDDLLLDFLRATYAAAADRAGWERHALERQAPR